MFQRFEGDEVIVDLLQEGQCVKVVTTNKAHQVLHRQHHDFDSSSDATRAFNNKCYVYEAIGFDPIGADC